MAKQRKKSNYLFGKNDALNTASCAASWLRHKEESTLRLASGTPGVTKHGFEAAIKILKEWKILNDPVGGTAFAAADYLIANNWHLMCVEETPETPRL